MTHFSDEEIVTLNALENKLLSTIKYHYWVNNTQANNPYQTLDYIEFQFIDGSVLFLSGKTKNGISIEKPDIEEERRSVKSKFGNNINVISLDMSHEILWQPTLSHHLEYVALRKGQEHHYLNDAVLMNFGEYEILIYHDEDGLLVEEMLDLEEDEDDE